MSELSNRIPLGMHLSVEGNNTPQKRHPVRDASLTGCKGRSIRSFSTERYIPNGMSKTVICFLFFIPYADKGKNAQILTALNINCLFLIPESNFHEAAMSYL